MTPLRALVFLCSSLMACHSHVVPSLSFPFFSSFYSSSQAPLHNSVTSTSSSTSSGPNSDTRELIESSQGDPSAPQQAEPEPDWGHMIRVAAGGGDLHRVRELHELGGSRVEHLNDEDGNGWQAIHEAARSGKVEVVEYLFNHGADIGHLTRGGGSVLFWAKIFKYESCVGYLEDIGAPDERDELYARKEVEKGGERHEAGADTDL